MTDSNWLMVMALPLEGQQVCESAGFPVLYTGVGKVNAATTLARALSAYRHVVNPMHPRARELCGCTVTPGFQFADVSYPAR